MKNNLATQSNIKINIIDVFPKCLIRLLSFPMIVPTILMTTLAEAQTLPSQPGNGNLNSNFNNFPSGQLNDIRTIRQPGGFFDSNKGSQRFFQRGSEQLYFLPNEEPESILEVESEIGEETKEKTEDRVRDSELERN